MLDTLLAKTWVRAHSALQGGLSRVVCHGLYDGEHLAVRRREAGGEVPVLLVIPAMSDVNGALPHPGVQILQTILSDRGVGCEVLNYNLPVIRPRDPIAHLIRAVRALGVKVVGVSTYSQAIRSTLEGLRRLKQACPDVTVVLGGPHPTEAYLSLMGVSFIDYVCRGEAEESFPALVDAVLAGRTEDARSIPGVYRYDRATGVVTGSPAAFVDLEALDERGALRYRFSPAELEQMRVYRGCHGTAGANYWPVALVRGCPYDCTFCAAYQMSGKKLRYRRVERVVDDLEFYQREYGRDHFSFIDDAFTQNYEYVVALCEEIIRRGLQVYWTTDNGIRYETLGRSRRLLQLLEQEGGRDVDGLLRLMIRAGWRGTAIGIESGSARVRKDLVRKGGARLSNEEILGNLRNLKRVAREEGVYFYVNGFLMAGFPELPLPRGDTVPAETEEEREQTRAFTLELRDAGAIDMMNLSMVIPLPATDMWECLAIDQKLSVLLSRVPPHHRRAPELFALRDRIIERYRDDLEATRYAEAPEAEFWKGVYALSDDAQILVMQSYDAFNADAAHELGLTGDDSEALWRYRESVVAEFYGGMSMKLKMLQHVAHRSHNAQDAAAYLTLFGRKLDPSEKQRSTA